MSANDTRTGIKYDAAKKRWSLLPLQEVEDIVAVLEFGAQKYSPDNWKFVPNAKQRYFDAMIRHMMAWWGGEKDDQESGMRHLAHAGCCLLFLMWLDRNDEESK